MGLDFSHGEAHWSYSGFNRFRRSLSAAAKLGALEAREGFGGQKAWPATTEDPIIVLLNHSDCDGDIDPAHLPALAARLDELAPLLEDFDASQARLLAAGCREAAAEGVPLEFC